MTTPHDLLLTELVKPNAYPMFVTGAGISVASGIAPFRGSDPDAVWNKDVTEKGTLRFFQQNPAESWKWYLERFNKCRGSEPNPGHTALVGIEEACTRFVLVTQNIDGLHVAAGSKNVIEIHGAARKMRCSNPNCVNGAPKGVMDWDDELFAAFQADPVFDNVPRCPACRKPVRAHVLWFDEGYSDHEDYGFERVYAVQEDISCLVFIGTSFSVGITMIVSQFAYYRNLPMFVIDPNFTKTPVEDAHLIQAKSEEYLPLLERKIAKHHAR